MQILRFSSSSLSKTIVSHFGHLVQRPSGISFFRCLPPSFGFFRKVVSLFAGGGVTAGSTSKPRVFFVNEVVAINLIHFSVTNRGPPSTHKLPPRHTLSGPWHSRSWWPRW